MSTEQPPADPVDGSAAGAPSDDVNRDGDGIGLDVGVGGGTGADVAETGVADPAAIATIDAMAGGFAFALEALREIQSAHAGLEAMEMALYAGVFEHAEALSKETSEPIADREMMIRSACAEIGATLRLSDRAVQRRMSDAYTVYTGFPQTFEALRAGAVTLRHVQEILKASDGLPIEVRPEFEDAALARALITTPARLAAVLPSVANQIHARSLTERHQVARKHRSVRVRDVEDGMAELIALLPAVLAHGIHDRLTSMAVAVEKGAPNDERCRDEIRADVFADLTLTGAPLGHGDGLAAIRANVQVSVPVTTLAGVADTGADLIGVGPVDAETARVLAGGQSGWDRVMAHPVSGAILAVDRYRPGEDLKRRLRVRDEHCRFPGCRQPAHRCDVDHSVAAAMGGQTRLDNLALLCKSHHTMKHAAHWQVAHEGHGVLRWTSPHGNIYVDTPTPVLRFYPSDTAPAENLHVNGTRRSRGDRSSGDAAPP